MLGNRSWDDWIVQYGTSHWRFLFVGLGWWFATIRDRA